MKVLQIISFVFLFLFVSSCKQDDAAEGCSSVVLKKGTSFAEGSYKNIDNYATYSHRKLRDGTYDTNRKKINLSSFDGRCTIAEGIYFNVDFSLNDTIQLHSSSTNRAGIGYSYRGNPTESYILMDDKDNWLIIDSHEILGHQSVIKGRFNASFITTDERYLHGVDERSDDRNRPNKLHFKNGEFTAFFVERY